MSKSSFPGGLRGKSGIETEALAHLLGHYDAYEPFLQSCRDARLELESPLTSPAKQQVMESLGPAAAEKLGERLLIRCVEREIIESLAKRWNLDRVSEVQDSLHENFKDGVAHIDDPMGDWVEAEETYECPYAGAIDDPMGTQDRRPFTFFGGGQLVPWEFTVSFAGRYWIWSPTSTRSFKDFRRGVMRDLGVERLRSLPPELRERFRELAREASDFRRYLSDTPSALDIHVRWLFLRLCPQPERPLKISEIAEREPQDQRHVDRSVHEVAKRLGIDLPPFRRGRPPNQAAT